MRLLKYLYVLSVLVFSAVQMVTFPLLPQTMASHFSIHMTPNGYMPKLQYFISVVSTFALINLLSLVVTALLPGIPSPLINAPKRQFWMRPENKPAFIDIMKERFYGFLFIINSIFTIVAYLVFKANKSDPIVLNAGIHIVIIIAFVMIFFGAIQLIVRLNRVDQDGN